jgi:predicted nucleic acid-binding protein
MIVADTAALISLASVDLFETLLTEFEVATTETVIDELDATSDYDDTHGRAAQAVLDSTEQLTVREVDGTLSSSQIDEGEGSCALLCNDLDAAFLITDDLRALPELQTAVDAQVAISPIGLKALVTRQVLDRQTALEKLDQLAEQRSWLGQPIYQRAQNLFEEQ